MTIAIDVLLPTCDRPCGLAVTLTTLAAQDFRDFRVIVSDQSASSVFECGEVQAVLRYLRFSGIEVRNHCHLPRRGMAEQRAFLLAQAEAPYCLFLDDDVVLESDLLGRLHRAMTTQRCGFVGSALHGLSFLDDVRPHQQEIEFWNGKVEPETVSPDTAAWARHHLHSAANLLHVQAKLGLTRENERLYRVAWVGGCVLFDRAKLHEAGGFDFWRELPTAHCGEDVLAQLRVMERFGGSALIPSGAYHMELPTTIPAREIDAPKVMRTAAGET